MSARGPHRRVWVARYRRRLLADGLDALLLLALNAGLWLSGLTRPDLPPPEFDALDHAVSLLTTHQGLLRPPLVLLIFTGVLGALVTRGLWGRTPGEALLGVRLEDARGAVPGPLRTLCHALLTALGLALLGLGHTVAAVDPARRTLADRLCRLWLVRDPAPRTSPVLPPKNPDAPRQG